MLRQDRHRHVLQKCGVRLSEAERDGVVVEHGDLLHVLVIRRVFRAVVGVHDGFDREFDVPRRERLAVVPLHPLAQVESIGAVCLVIVPALGEGGNDLVIAVVRGQAVEEQQVDLTVLVHRGIDARVVGRAVDERGRRVVGRIAAALPAGSEGEEHREGQQKSQRFFHGKLLWGKCGNAASPDAAKNMTVCSIGEIPARHKPGGGYDGQSFSKKSRRAAEIPRFLSFLRIALALSARQWYNIMPKIQQRSLLFMKLGIERNGPDFISLQKSAKVHKSPQLQGVLGFERHKTQCRTLRLHAGLVQ